MKKLNLQEGESQTRTGEGEREKEEREQPNWKMSSRRISVVKVRVAWQPYSRDGGKWAAEHCSNSEHNNKGTAEAVSFESNRYSDILDSFAHLKHKSLELGYSESQLVLDSGTIGVCIVVL